MRVGADAGKGEFGHVGLGRDHRACRAQPAQHRCVGRSGRRIREHLGSCARRLTGDVEQVLDADDRAIERTKAYAGTRSRIRRVGCGAGGLGIDGEAGEGTLAVRVGDASERLFQPVARGAGRRSAAPGRLLLRPRNVWRSKQRRGRARQMQESTTDHLHVFLPTVRFFVDASRGHGRCHRRVGTSARSRR